MGGAETFFGMRYCTYIWSIMIWPDGAAPVGGESGNAVAAACPLTKKTPSSWSSSGPPSEPAAAAVIAAGGHGGGEQGHTRGAEVRICAHDEILPGIAMQGLRPSCA